MYFFLYNPSSKNVHKNVFKKFYKFSQTRPKNTERAEMNRNLREKTHNINFYKMRRDQKKQWIL